MRYHLWTVAALLAFGSHTALAQSRLGLYSPANPEDKAINLSTPRNDKIQRGIAPGQAPYTNSLGQVTAPANGRVRRMNSYNPAAASVNRTTSAPATVQAQAGSNSRDPNHWRYRYANNQWWYYQTNNRWVVWQNGHWQEPRAASHQPQATHPAHQQPTLAQPATQSTTEQPHQTGFRGTTMSGTQTNDGPVFGSQPSTQASPTRDQGTPPATTTPGAPQPSDSKAAADLGNPQK